MSLTFMTHPYKLKKKQAVDNIPILRLLGPLLIASFAS